MINDVAKEVIERFGCNPFVETGLHEGETVFLVRKWFPYKWLISLELDPTWIVTCKGKDRSICYVEGSSEVRLKTLVDAGCFNHTTPFFYLDAHWNEYCPLIDEIAQVLRVPNAVLAIDDFDQEGAAPPWSFEHQGRTHTLDIDFIREHVPENRAKAVYRPTKPNAHGVGMCFVFLDQDDKEVQRRVKNLPLTRTEL